jgi:hypothetical protein
VLGRGESWIKLKLDFPDRPCDIYL